MIHNPPDPHASTQAPPRATGASVRQTEDMDAPHAVQPPHAIAPLTLLCTPPCPAERVSLLREIRARGRQGGDCHARYAALAQVAREDGHPLLAARLRAACPRTCPRCFPPLPLP